MGHAGEFSGDSGGARASTAGAQGYADNLDSTGFFTTTAPTFVATPTRWTAANEAVRMSLEYDEDRRGLFLVELDDVAREISYLEGGATLLQLVAPEGMTLLDLSEGWALVEAPTALRQRSTRHGEPAWDLSVRLRSSVQPLSSTPLEVELRFTIFAGNEPYLLVEPFLFGDLELGTHVAIVRYARMPLPLVERIEPFGQYSNHHVLAAADKGLWVSAGNYNTEVAAVGEHDIRVQARANVYLDQYLPLADGSLGAWMIGTCGNGRDAARYDYQLFLLKHWVAGSHETIAPHVHDYWYSTRGGVSSSQPERLAELAPLVQESGFHFFWFIYDNHGVWPDWGPTPAQYFPGGVDVSNSASITAAMADHGIPVGLYTAPYREVYDQQHHLQQPLCEDYGELLGEITNISGAPIWWYEDHPGESYVFAEGTGNQPPGDASWMWRQGYMTTRRALREAAPGTSICRTWVDSVEQLGWAEACSALDVFGSGANQSGGSTKDSDYSLVNNWRRAVWELVPVWPLLNHIGHHPVHVRDSSRTAEDTNYIDSSAAMMGPFALNGPLASTTSTEREIHAWWTAFNWQNRELLRFSFLAQFVGDPGAVDGIYHLVNPRADGRCGVVGLWNRSSTDDSSVELTVPLEALRLRWSGPLQATAMNGETEVDISIEGNEVHLGPLTLGPRSWQVLDIRTR